MLGSALDTLMDLTVVPGYTAIGPRVRRRVAGWQRDLPRMDDRVVLVTGATAGIGLAAAHGFASLGAAVILVARDEGKGARVRDELAATTGNDRLRVEVCDVSSLASVRALAARLAGEPLHVLVHNAGLLPARRSLTGEGFELAFATNVLGPFLLTSLLEAQLVASAPSRVVWVSSGGMYTERIDVEDLQSERIAGDWDGPAVYARTKRAEVILSEQWARAPRGHGGERPRDAPRVGGDGRGGRVAAALQPGDGPAAAHAPGGRRHDRLARRGGRSRADQRRVLVRPARAPDAPAAAHARDAAGARCAVGRLRRTERCDAARPVVH